MDGAETAGGGDELTRGTIEPRAPAEGSGEEIAAYGGPVEYEAFAREGMRHGWTLRPDPDGRHHALTLQWQEDDGTWVVTAAPAFESLEAARAWATRLDSETEETA